MEKLLSNQNPACQLYLTMREITAANGMLIGGRLRIPGFPQVQKEIEYYKNG